jgi:hypothetical protein
MFAVTITRPPLIVKSLGEISSNVIETRRLLLAEAAVGSANARIKMLASNTTDKGVRRCHKLRARFFVWSIQHLL